jgi:hypothetical protein
MDASIGATASVSWKSTARLGLRLVKRKRMLKGQLVFIDRLLEKL